MSDDDSDDDLPLFSNLRQETGIFEHDDNPVQRSRYTLTTRTLKAGDVSSLSRSGDPAHLDLAPLKTTADFISMLDKLKVPGPLTITEALDSSHQIGMGGQFIVYWNDMVADDNGSNHTWVDKVAVKKCKFEDVEENQILDLSSRKYRGQVHDMQLEVAALQDFRLRDHPNIVKLIGWGLEQQTWHHTPFLVMPLALNDLTGILQGQVQQSVLHQLLLDIGYGLDAIHDCRIIHGDLKPDNVLVFETFSEPMPLIARLADFGLSLDEVNTVSGGSVSISGYSAGWAAPEIVRAYHQKSLVPIATLLSSDRFSFGLLLLSAFCYEGKVLPANSYRTANNLHETIAKLPTTFSEPLKSSLLLILHQIPELRPERIGGILQDKTEASLVWTRERDKYELWQAEQQKRVSQIYRHAWELPRLAGLLVLGLENSYRTYRDLLTGPQLFAMFLLRSVHDITNADKELQVGMLLDAARQGFCPAQGVAQIVIESYGMPITDYLTEAEAKTWLNNAVASGLLVESCGMGQLAQPEFEKHRIIFNRNAGYNQFYSPITKPEKVELIHEEHVEKLQWQSPVDKYKNTTLHQLASYGDIEQIGNLLDRGFPGINERNTLGETALYKACLSGHVEVVLLLCQKGADASLTATHRRITCLHWMLNFPAASLEQIISAMLAAGADLNATLVGQGSLINHHFPLRWPAGTPLHWAVAASNPATVKALLGNCADPNIRNGQDPYKADENVRHLHSHGTTEQGEFSSTPDTCLGLTAVDLAVANHDWRILEGFSSNQRDNNSRLLTVDEEGYSPFHRLSQNRIGNTSTGSRFWYPAFMGDTATRRNNLRRTVQALKMMGGDINQLTTPAFPYGLLCSAKGGLSPLMIAVTKSDHEVVDLLCDEGAKVNLQNTCGHTALTLVRNLNVAGLSPPGSISSIVRSLVDRGAEINYQSPDGVTPLLCASSSGDLTAVEILAENGVDLTNSAGLLAMAHMTFGIRHVTNMGHSLMSIDASEQRELELATLIENHIAPAAMSNPLLVGEQGKTLVHCCANAALFACVKVLVDAGASVNAIEESGTPTYVGGYWISDGSKIHGTPLDVVVQTEKLFETERSGRLSQAKVDYIFDKFKSIRKLLINHGGKTKAQSGVQGVA